MYSAEVTIDYLLFHQKLTSKLGETVGVRWRCRIPFRTIRDDHGVSQILCSKSKYVTQELGSISIDKTSLSSENKISKLIIHEERWKKIRLNNQYVFFIRFKRSTEMKSEMEWVYEILESSIEDHIIIQSTWTTIVHSVKIF